MAQTKNRRKTKHRGNAAGMIESRGRTGRKPTAAEKSGGAKAKAQPKKVDRLDRPPTWKGAFYRSVAAAVIMLLISFVLIKKTTQSIALFPIVLVLYVPISYYTDLWLFRRRQRQKAAKAEKAKA